MKCRKHPKYRAIRMPRIPCEGCWWVWFFHPDGEDWRMPSHSVVEYED